MSTIDHRFQVGCSCTPWATGLLIKRTACESWKNPLQSCNWHTMKVWVRVNMPKWNLMVIQWNCRDPVLTITHFANSVISHVVQLLHESGDAMPERAFCWFRDLWNGGFRDILHESLAHCEVDICRIHTAFRVKGEFAEDTSYKLVIGHGCRLQGRDKFDEMRIDLMNQSGYRSFARSAHAIL